MIVLAWLALDLVGFIASFFSSSQAFVLIIVSQVFWCLFLSCSILLSTCIYWCLLQSQNHIYFETLIYFY